MKQITEKLRNLFQHYSHFLGIATANMRLILLILFGILSGYLVVRVNALVTDKPIVNTAASDTIYSKKPDSDVISVFNELQSQNVVVNSQFDSQRNNPF
jgi:hypothetical protein